jgi:flagellar FliL protein
MAAETTGSEGKKKKLNIGIDVRWLGIGVGAFVVAMGLAYFMFRSLLGGLIPDPVSGVPTEIALVEIGDFTTNTADTPVTTSGGGTVNRYVRVQISLSVPTGQEEIVTQFMPIIKDTILSVLSQKTASQLNANSEELKNDIKSEINDRLGTRLVEGVFFTNFLMQ